MGPRRGDREAQISLGVRPNRQLRLAHRTRRRLAALHPWRRPRTPLFDRRGSARQGRSLARARALARTARPARDRGAPWLCRSEEHTSELQSLMRISYAVFCLKKKKIKYSITTIRRIILRNIILIYNQ